MKEKEKHKTQPPPGNLPSSSVPKNGKAKELAFHTHTFSATDPSWFSYVWDISEALGRCSELERDSKPRLRRVVAASRAVGQPAFPLLAQELTSGQLGSGAHACLWGELNSGPGRAPRCLTAQGSSSSLGWQFALPILAQRVRTYTQKPDYLASNPDSSPSWLCEHGSVSQPLCCSALISKLRAIIKLML